MKTHRFLLLATVLAMSVAAVLIGLAGCDEDPVISNNPPRFSENPLNYAPRDNVDNVSINPTIEWACGDPDGDPMTFDVYFGSSLSSRPTAMDLTTNRYSPGRLQYKTRYYWYVVASDGEDTCCSDTFRFTTVDEDPACRVSRTTIDFGVVPIDSCRRDSFEISNDGGSELSGDVSMSCGDYVIRKGRGGFHLERDESVWVVVDFCPSSAATQECVIQLGTACTNVICRGTVAETVSSPDTPNGPSSGHIDSLYTFFSGGASSNLEHALEYQFDFDDGETSTWKSSTAASHSWGDSGTYCIRARARCIAHPTITSEWSECHIIDIEEGCSVGLPTISGPDSLCPDETGYFTASGSVCSCGPIEYRFFFDDGDTTEWSDLATADHRWSERRGYSIRAQTRCSQQTEVVSDWSGAHNCIVAFRPVCEVSESHINFYNVCVSGSKERTFTITNSGCGRLSGTVTSNSPTVFKVVGDPTYSLDDGESDTIRVSFEPRTVGAKQATILLGSTCPSIQCSGTGDDCEPPVCSLSTTSLGFGTVCAGDIADRSFQICNAGAGTLTGSIRENCDEFTIGQGAGPYSLGAGECKGVSIRFRPESEGSKTCNIETGCGSYVRCSGTGDTPHCTVGPTQLKFGDVCVGSHADREFTIRNTGCGNLSGSITVDCVHYRIISGGGPYSLGAGQNKTVTVRFEPTSSGTKNCTIHTGSGCLDVECTGSGDNCCSALSPSVAGPASLCESQGGTYSASGGGCTCGPTEHRFQWGDGAISNWSSSSSASHSWSPGDYCIRAQTRCADDHGVESPWSSCKNVSVESHIVSTPDQPDGPDMWYTGQPVRFSTGGSHCSCVHSIRYRFEWGDGSQSSWSSSIEATHEYNTTGEMQVRAQARCAADGNITSNWSSSKTVSICGSGQPLVADDSYVVSGDSTENYGGDGDLYIGDGVQTYIRFDLSSVPNTGSIENAALKLHVGSLIGSTNAIIARARSPWNENTITWNNQPGPHIPIEPYEVDKPNGQFQWWVINVTDIVREWIVEGEPNCGFLLSAEESGQVLISIDSKEGDYAPRLEVNYCP